MSEFDACKVVALSVAETLIDATGTARSVAAVIAIANLEGKMNLRKNLLFCSML